MKTKSVRIILPLLIAIASLIYAIGDYYKWWDDISGRTSATRGLERLESPHGYPEIVIFNDEAEFQQLLDFILYGTENHKVIDRYRTGITPSAIVRVGGTLRPDVGDDLPEDWPNPKFVPSSSPVAVVYDYIRPGSGKINIVNTEPIGNLRDVRQWVNDSRNSERFIVSTVLIGLLSIVVIVLDVTKSGKKK